MSAPDAARAPVLDVEAAWQQRQGCTGKVRYARRRDAEAARERCSKPAQLHPYRCRFCRGGFHLGHRHRETG